MCPTNFELNPLLIVLFLVHNTLVELIIFTYFYIFKIVLKEVEFDVIQDTSPIFCLDLTYIWCLLL